VKQEEEMMTTVNVMKNNESSKWKWRMTEVMINVMKEESDEILIVIVIQFYCDYIDIDTLFCYWKWHENIDIIGEGNYYYYSIVM